ncbi:MAG: hypothetical protein LKE51_09540 [Selenomonas sp.]|nr:hypothetical protein [Selenomonas sp.]
MDGADRAGQAEPAAGGLARTGCAVHQRKELPRARDGMPSPGGHALSRASCSPAYSCDVDGPELAALTVWTGGNALGYGDHALRV